MVINICFGIYFVTNVDLMTFFFKKRLNLPVKLWDERMSTSQVERVMIDGGASRAKRKKKIDKLAAQIILQSYLNTTTQKL